MIPNVPRAKPCALDTSSPSIPAVLAAPQRRTFTATFETPWRAQHFPRARPQDVGVVRLHNQIDSPSLLGNEEHFRPRGTTIRGLEDAAFGVGSRQVPQCSNPNRVRIFGVHTNAGDVARLGEPHELEALAGIRGLPDAVAAGHVAPDRLLPFTNPNHGRLGRSHRHGADRAAERPVGDALPRFPRVLGLEDPAASSAEVVGVAIAHDPRDRAGAPAAVRPDLPPREPLKQAQGHGRWHGQFLGLGVWSRVGNRSLFGRLYRRLRFLGHTGAAE